MEQGACPPAFRPVPSTSIEVTGHARRQLPNRPRCFGHTRYDKANRLQYRVDKQDGKLYLEVKRGSAVGRAEMTYALGSGKLAVTFVRELDADNYEELRVSYYSQTGGWDLTPGQRTARPTWAADALGRPIKKHGELGCLNCHASLLVQSEGKIDGARSRFSVDCERCHGPGREHVESAGRGTPVKPRAPELNEALRAAQSLRDGKRPESPFEELLKSLVEVDDERLIRDVYVCGECHGRTHIFDPPSDEQLSKLPVAALVSSACYQRSATKLLCGDCHDPHGDSPRDDRPYVAVCMKCHSDDLCPERDSNAGCIGCHMPVRSPLPHTHYTHHRIAIYPRAETVNPHHPHPPPDAP